MSKVFKHGKKVKFNIYDRYENVKEVRGYVFELEEYPGFQFTIWKENYWVLGELTTGLSCGSTRRTIIGAIDAFQVPLEKLKKAVEASKEVRRPANSPTYPRRGRGHLVNSYGDILCHSIDRSTFTHLYNVGYFVGHPLYSTTKSLKEVCHNCARIRGLEGK